MQKNEHVGTFSAILKVEHSLAKNGTVRAEVFELTGNKISFRAAQEWLIFKGQSIQATLFPLIQKSEIAAVTQGLFASVSPEGVESLNEVAQKGLVVNLSNITFERSADNVLLVGTCQILQASPEKSDSHFNRLMAFAHERREKIEAAKPSLTV